MKSILALVVAAGAAFSAQVPRQAPEFAIHMADGSQKLLSSYRGKTVALALVFTSCVHCQHMMGTLNGVQKEYAARGVQVLAGAFNDVAKDPASLDFVGRFATTYVNGFPAGWVDKLSAFEFLQHSEKEAYFVPILVFIDKKGVIRQQVLGDEKYLGDPETNVRASIDAILKAPPAPAPVHKKTVTTSSTK
jgi:thiol-disulfide isomerase/thioredoxin